VRFWEPVRTLVEQMLPRMSPNQLASIILSMCRSGHRANKTLVDTLLLPALRPHFAAIVDAAQSDQQAQQHDGKDKKDTNANGGQVLQYAPRHTVAAGQQLTPEHLLALLGGLAAFSMQPRVGWWQLYQAAIVASLPALDVYSITTALSATARLARAPPAPWSPLLLRALPPWRVRGMDAASQVTLLAALGKLADSGGVDTSQADVGTFAELWRGAHKRLIELGAVSTSDDGGGGGGGSTGSGSAARAALGAVSCDVLVAAGQLQCARADVVPPVALLADALMGSIAALEAGPPRPAVLAQLALSVEILGLQPTAAWCDR
jgi:hypothetical protein